MTSVSVSIDCALTCCLSFRSPLLNFTNNLRAAFSYESVLSSLSVLTFRSVIFWRKEIGAKAARRTLVKLTPCRRRRPPIVNFTW